MAGYCSGPGEFSVSRCDVHDGGRPWNVLDESEVKSGEVAMVETTLEGVVDNSRCPTIDVKIQLKVGRPKGVEKPVPTLMMFSFFGWSRPGATTNRPAFRIPGPTPPEILAKAGWGYAIRIPNSI